MVNVVIVSVKCKCIYIENKFPIENLNHKFKFLVQTMSRQFLFTIKFYYKRGYPQTMWTEKGKGVPEISMKVHMGEGC